MLDAQMKRGLIENCVLAATARGDSYGYKIVKDLSVMRQRHGINAVSDTAAAGVGGLPARCTPWSTAGGSENFIISRSWGERTSRLRGQLG